MDVYLNSFLPICANKFGRNSIISNSLQPFIDGSFRREPDFQNNFPAITQLCRPGKLVPRLKRGDLIIYITKKGNFGNDYPHWRFIAILEVIYLCHNHFSAANYYHNYNIPVSQNIFCVKTSPFALNMTHGICGFKHGNLSPTRIINLWDEFYKKLSLSHGQTAITKVWKNHLYLVNPAILTKDTMLNIFGRIPGTQNPPKLTNAEWENFKNAMNI